MTLDAATIARERGGVRAGAGWAIRCPVPGHGRGRGDQNPSCTIRDGKVHLLVYCHAGCDWLDILQALGVKAPRRPEPAVRRSPRPPASPELTDAQRRHCAFAAWADAVDPRGTLVEDYLASRGIKLPDLAVDVLRYHPSCPWRDGEHTSRVPAMLAAMRTIDGDDLVAVHRTRLTPDGRKVDRRMLGSAGAAAIKLDNDESVEAGLAIGEGIETCLSGRQLGIGRVWALGSAGAIGRFPVLPAIQSLTILAENDETSRRAVREVAGRWDAAGREVIVVSPTIGNDVNDAIRGAA